MLKVFTDFINPMFEMMFEELLKQAKAKDENSILYRHHVKYIEEQTTIYADNENTRIDAPGEGRGKIRRAKLYRDNAPCDLVIDFMAGMTDDYFVDLFHHLFPKSSYEVEYKGYFKS